jgi:hypothetical protein
MSARSAGVQGLTTRTSQRQRTRLQIRMREDLLDGQRIEDRGDARQLALRLPAVIDGKWPNSASHRSQLYGRAAWVSALYGGEFAGSVVAGRPIPARRASPKLPDAQRWLLEFRCHEAAVRDLRQPASSCTWPRTGSWR